MSSERIGDALKCRRLSLNLRQSDVADRAGIKPPYMSMLERGEDGVTLRTLRRVAVALRARLCIRVVPEEAGLPEEEIDELLQLYQRAPAPARALARRLLAGAGGLDARDVKTLHDLLGVWRVPARA